MDKVGVGVIGSQFIAEIHAESLAGIPNAEIVAVASPTQTHVSDFADLLRGSSLETYSEEGYDYAVEKASTTRGWSFTMFEEAWNYGFPQEMQHFVNCVAGDEVPLETGEDGRAVMQIIFAAYESAGTGRKVQLPFAPPEGKRPIDLWLR